MGFTWRTLFKDIPLEDGLLTRKFGERRDKRDSEVVTFAFNNQSIEEEMPQAVL